MIQNNTDMILILETKVNSLLPNSQSEIEGHIKNMLNWNTKG